MIYVGNISGLLAVSGDTTFATTMAMIGGVRVCSFVKRRQMERKEFSCELL